MYIFVSRFCTTITIAGVILIASILAYSGNLNPPAGTTSAASAMYTVSDIYNRLDSGSATAKRTGALASHVLFGRTFWGLTSAGWGMQTGTIATQTLGSGTTAVAAGYYEATTLDVVDADLATGNIKSGVSIFGVAGSPSVVDTASGDAVAGEILRMPVLTYQTLEVPYRSVTPLPMVQHALRTVLLRETGACQIGLNLRACSI